MINFDEFTVDDDLEPMALKMSPVPSIDEAVEMEQDPQDVAPDNRAPSVSQDAAPQPTPQDDLPTEEPMDHDDDAQAPIMQETIDPGPCLSPCHDEVLDSNEVQGTSQHNVPTSASPTPQARLHGVDAARRAAVCNIAAGLRARVVAFRGTAQASKEMVEQQGPTAIAEQHVHRAMAEQQVDMAMVEQQARKATVEQQAPKTFAEHAPKTIPEPHAPNSAIAEPHVPNKAIPEQHAPNKTIVEPLPRAAAERPCSRPTHHLSPPQRPPRPASSANDDGRPYCCACVYTLP